MRPNAPNKDFTLRVLIASARPYCFGGKCLILNWLPLKGSYRVNLNDLYTAVAKIPRVVPQHFGG
ncbi:hypothetical protein SBA5_880018 [Candidatus Sulfotelmatomonas gaucii]|uniref:Uncharacterized protein n=1 Tax=Candidatus Sulfuritelmatomonas gaucii TaxID=2043161 RepID=A0A2N9M7D2_9BACT|nr:hypothetical protein SBA5_880018 [Candidatus Sulfotelmatomonas gaucii]